MDEVCKRSPAPRREEPQPMLARPVHVHVDPWNGNAAGSHS